MHQIDINNNQDNFILAMDNISGLNLTINSLNDKNLNNKKKIDLIKFYLIESIYYIINI